jgi:DNA primase
LSRGLKPETIKKFGIGFFPSNYFLPKEVRYISDYDNITEDTPDYIYNFKNKITLPIFDDIGNLVGIATRTPDTLGIDGKKNFWWNTPFKKKNCCFGLNYVNNTVLKHSKAYIVEGYMDAILLQQEEIKNTVCIMGTAFNEFQYSILLRYCSELCFCFDPDESGEKAKKRAFGIILKMSKLYTPSKIGYIDVPEGLDPDEFILKYGKEEFCGLEKVITIDEIKEQELMEAI